jgi:exodeoxyribonuclease-3
MQEEIDGLNNILSADFIDTFRFKKGDEIKYSWWSYRAGARKKNIGWRIDYFLISPKLADKIQDADILTEIPGSDHCPILLDLKI